MLKRLKHRAVVAQFGDKPQFYLRIIGRKQRVIGGISCYECTPNFAPLGCAYRYVLQIRVLATESTRSRQRLIVRRVYSARSRIYLRLIAELSNDSSMLEAFQQGLDIHQATAAKVYDVPLADVTSDQRRNAKTVNFAIVYGAGASNISQQLSISRSEAKSLIDNYFKTYSGLKGYMDSNIQAARDNGYVVTMLGRRRTLRDINSQSGVTRAGAERTAINSPVQGSAADLIKVAMIKIHNEFINRNLKSKMLLQVHDELIFDVHNDEKEVVEKIVSDGMRFAIEGLKVPIEVGMGFGENWLEAH